jgi:hypothetical protein
MTYPEKSIQVMELRLTELSLRASTLSSADDESIESFHRAEKKLYKSISRYFEKEPDGRLENQLFITLCVRVTAKRFLVQDNRSAALEIYQNAFDLLQIEAERKGVSKEERNNWLIRKADVSVMAGRDFPELGMGYYFDALVAYKVSLKRFGWPCQAFIAFVHSEYVSLF